MIYFDNAATTYKKPLCVKLATLQGLSVANPGRSGHRLSLKAAQKIFKTRLMLQNFFNAPRQENVIFTQNCTEALNTAIFGTLKKGDHVITTVYEHNSVLRPLYHLKKLGLISLSIIAPSGDIPLEKQIENSIRKDTYLIVCSSASNVTGEVLPIRKIGEIAKKHSLLFLVDGAQGCGHIPLSLKDDNISMLAVAGHKGLYGIMGSGALVFNDTTEIAPLMFGGTGTETFNYEMPSSYPERLEAGTLSLPAIASLGEGVSFVKDNLHHFAEQIKKATERIIDDLSSVKNVKIYSNPNRVGIVAIKFLNIDSALACDTLDKEFDIAVRGGFHCAPLLHKFLKTDDSGLVRISLAVQNSSNEISSLLSAVKKIAKD
jgi:cysteine desulfurase family protein